MYEHVKTGRKHIPPTEQPLQYYMNKPRSSPYVKFILSSFQFISLDVTGTSKWV